MHCTKCSLVYYSYARVMLDVLSGSLSSVEGKSFSVLVHDMSAYFGL